MLRSSGLGSGGALPLVFRAAAGAVAAWCSGWRVEVGLYEVHTKTNGLGFRLSGFDLQV